MCADAGNRNQQIVPGPHILILFHRVLDRLIEGGDFRFQAGNHPSHRGISHRGFLARGAPVGPLHPRRVQRLTGAHQIAQLAQGG